MSWWPTPAWLAARLRAGAGGLLILGPEITAQQAGTLLGFAVTIEPREEAVTLSEVAAAEDDLVRQILWNTAPQVRERYAVSGSGLQSLVQVHDGEETLITRTAAGRAAATLYLVSARLDGNNGQFRDWGYYNYLI